MSKTIVICTNATRRNENRTALLIYRDSNIWDTVYGEFLKVYFISERFPGFGWIWEPGNGSGNTLILFWKIRSSQSRLTKSYQLTIFLNRCGEVYMLVNTTVRIVPSMITSIMLPKTEYFYSFLSVSSWLRDDDGVAWRRYSCAKVVGGA